MRPGLKPRLHGWSSRFNRAQSRSSRTTSLRYAHPKLIGPKSYRELKKRTACTCRDTGRWQRRTRKCSSRSERSSKCRMSISESLNEAWRAALRLQGFLAGDGLDAPAAAGDAGETTMGRVRGAMKIQLRLAIAVTLHWCRESRWPRSAPGGAHRRRRDGAVCAGSASRRQHHRRRHGAPRIGATVQQPRGDAGSDRPSRGRSPGYSRSIGAVGRGRTGHRCQACHSRPGAPAPARRWIMHAGSETQPGKQMDAVNGLMVDSRDRAEDDLPGPDLLLQLRADAERVPGEPREVREEAEGVRPHETCAEGISAAPRDWPSRSVRSASGISSTAGVSAKDQPGRVEEFLARRVRNMAIARQAKSLTNPVEYSGEVIAEGRAHFADHCAICHGNDGSGNTPMGRGMWPKAPDMRLAQTQNLSDGELFWIIENGIRFTGMPAWSTGTKDGETASWHLVHFVRRLPKLTPEEIKEMESLNPKSPAEIRQQIEEEKSLKGGTKPPPAPVTPHRHSGDTDDRAIYSRRGACDSSRESRLSLLVSLPELRSCDDSDANRPRPDGGFSSVRHRPRGSEYQRSSFASVRKADAGSPPALVKFASGL